MAELRFRTAELSPFLFCVYMWFCPDSRMFFLLSTFFPKNFLNLLSTTSQFSLSQSLWLILISMKPSLPLRVPCLSCCLVRRALPLCHTQLGVRHREPPSRGVHYIDTVTRDPETGRPASTIISMNQLMKNHYKCHTHWPNVESFFLSGD